MACLGSPVSIRVGGKVSARMVFERLMGRAALLAWLGCLAEVLCCSGCRIQKGGVTVSKRRGLSLCMIVALMLAMLTGCVSAEGEMTLYRKGKWEAGFDLTVSREMVALAGGEASLDDAVEGDMEQRRTRAKEHGARFSFEKVRSDRQAIIYRLELSGNDIESLNGMLEGAGQAQFTEGPNGEESRGERCG